MPRSTAEELAIESRRTQVAGLFLRGVRRQSELAQRVGVDRSTVSRDLKVLNARWKESAVRDLDAAKGQELERIDQMEREYWDAWEKSKNAHETTTTEQITGGDGERLKAGIRKDEQCGDPRYLAGVQWCVNKRCEILGLHAPQKVAPTNPDGTKEYGALTDQQRLAGYHAILARLGQGRLGRPVPADGLADGGALGGPGRHHGPGGDGA
jgi:hypothetical protein